MNKKWKTKVFEKWLDTKLCLKLPTYPLHLHWSNAFDICVGRDQVICSSFYRGEKKNWNYIRKSNDYASWCWSSTTNLVQASSLLPWAWVVLQDAWQDSIFGSGWPRWGRSHLNPTLHWKLFVEVPPWHCTTRRVDLKRSRLSSLFFEVAGVELSPISGIDGKFLKEGMCLTCTWILWGWIKYFNLVLIGWWFEILRGGMNKGVVSHEFSGLTSGVAHGGMRSWVSWDRGSSGYSGL